HSPAAFQRTPACPVPVLGGQSASAGSARWQSRRPERPRPRPGRASPPRLSAPPRPRPAPPWALRPCPPAQSHCSESLPGTRAAAPCVHNCCQLFLVGSRFKAPLPDFCLVRHDLSQIDMLGKGELVGPFA